ncbi:MAG TPA: hypothetical protein VGW80_11135 [Solirubrobacterales bacterium]|jgi:hypothetical protein|nr:hypothetical protein [Solirubrobacterales bacterium]
MSAEATCAICGRTILAGERVHGFVEAREERSVCELCVARAERLAWRPAGEPEPERSADGHEGRWRLRGLLRRRERRPGAPVAVAPAPQQRAEPEQGPEPEPVSPRRRPRPLPSPDPAAPSPFERAVARFNSSEGGRTVAGLSRSLGTPFVSIGAAAGEPNEVRITVAWELSWYQWGVDIGDELRPVFQIDKGGEIDQLDSAARQWNASVGEDGRLMLAERTAQR